MKRVLIVPAAGLGSRLGGPLPKLLVRVAGAPMIDRLVLLYRSMVSAIVLVVHPSFAGRVETHVKSASLPIECVIQPSPTGMLDAIVLAREAVARQSPASVWVTWCDQVGVDPRTVARLDDEERRDPGAAVVMPTVRVGNPYIHLDRTAGRITRVLHRREGDTMPPEGESDMGLFALAARTYCDLLPRYAADMTAGRGTGERNFLPFLAWADSGGERVVTFPATDPREAIGVNDANDLARVEDYLRSRG